MKDLVLGLWQDDSAQDMAEYALLLALIAVVILTAMSLLRGAIAGSFQQAAETI